MVRLVRLLAATAQIVLRYLDFILAFVAGFFYYLVWFPRGPTILSDPLQRDAVLASIKESIGVGITACSIFIPAVLIVMLFIAEKAKSMSALTHCLVALWWFCLAVFFGSWNLGRLPTMVSLDINLAYDPQTAWLGGMQFTMNTLGIIRFFLAGYELYRHLRRIPSSSM